MEIEDVLRLVVAVEALVVAILYAWQMPKELRSARGATGDARKVYLGRVGMQAGIVFGCTAVIASLIQLVIADAPFAGLLVFSQAALVGFVFGWAYSVQRRALQSPEGKEFTVRK